MKLNLEDLGLDIQKPILIPNLSTYHDDQTKPLSLDNLSSSPLGDLQINYFTDSTKVGALKPNSIASLSEIVHNVTNDFNSKIKIGTQIPVENYPSLIHNVAPNDIVTQLFGNHFRIDDLNPYLGIFPPLTTVPIFLARGLNESAPEKSHHSINQIHHQRSSSDHQHHTDNSTIQRNVRTDLHCEPIGNISIQQLKGSEQ